MKHHPPKWADKLLVWYCNPDLLEDLQGDLYEIFEQKCNTGQIRNANWLYFWLVLRSFRISVIKRNYSTRNSTYIMAGINLKIATRVLLKDKINTTLNLFGLTIGIACFLLLGLYVKQETTFDNFHSKKDRIYRSWLKETYDNGNVFYNSVTPPRFEKFFEENIPEVETAIQFNVNEYLIGRGEDKVTEELAVISPEFFEIFDFKLINGKTENPLDTREAIVISKKYAKKYFGNDNPIGKSITVEIDEEDKRDFVVSSVFEDIPVSSSFQFNMAISNVINDELFGERYKNAWFSVGPETYVVLQENADVEKISEKAEEIAMGLIGEARALERYQIGLQPLTDIHLNPDIPLGYAAVSNPQYVYILGGIGLLVLIIACINYATLAIGQSIKRGKEVGVRKVLGAVRPNLISQYMSESIIVVFIAMLFGTLIAIISIPTFNRLTNSNLQIVFELWQIGAFILGVLIIGLVAGFYPSLILSKLQILDILSGRSNANHAHIIRKGMVIFQFLITVFLISSTLIMRQQVNYLQNEDLGYTYETALAVELFPKQGEDTSFVSRHYSTMANGELLKAALKKYPEITEIGIASHTFGSNGWANLVANEEDGTYWRFRFLMADPYFIPSFGIEMVEGRNFELDNISDERQGVILNQAAVELFKMEDPVGKKLPPTGFGDNIVIGVTSNFHYSSLHNKVDPLIIVQNPIPILRGISDGDMAESPVPKLMFTYNGPNLSKAREILEKEWQSVFPNAEMNWSFLDETIKQQYENETRMNKLVTTATVMSIVIAMLGLVGLIILVVNSKVKEIGIRKVMGAGTGTVFKLLAKSFTIQIIIAIVLSIPITIWMMNNWLDNFAYRINISSGVFVISAAIAALVAVLILGYHALRAARVNPIESLRTE